MTFLAFQKVIKHLRDTFDHTKNILRITNFQKERKNGKKVGKNFVNCSLLPGRCF